MNYRIQMTFFPAGVLLAILFMPHLCRAESPDLGMSIRTIAAYVDNYESPIMFGPGDLSDFISQTIIRITAEGEAFNSEYEIHAVQNLLHTTTGNSSSFTSQSAADYRALDTTLDWLPGRRTTASAYLDRFNFRFEFARMDLTIGRQAITFGKAWFWNPLDVFHPFNADSFDRDYKPGVDALRYEHSLGNFSGLTIVAAAGTRNAPPGAFQRDPHSLRADWYGSALIARYFTSLREWDYSVQAGKIYSGYQAGAGAVGMLGPYQLRFEGAYFIEEDSPALLYAPGKLFEDHAEIVLGIGRYYNSTLDVELEYLFNDAGEDAVSGISMIRSQYGATRHIGRHIIGVTVSSEYSPLFTGRYALIHSLSDQSSVFQPVYTLSTSNNSEFVVGGTFNFGPHPAISLGALPDIRSEFGTYPDYIFSELKIYF